MNCVLQAWKAAQMEKQQVVGSSLIFFVQTPLGEIGGHYNQGPIKQTTFFF